MKHAVHISLRNHLLLGSLALFTACALQPASAEDEVPLKKLSRDQQPARVVVTGKLPPKEGTLPEKDPNAPPAWRGRQPMDQDATGTVRSADEPRFVTGSYVKQRFDIFGNAAATAYNVRVADQNDLRRGGFLGGTGVRGSMLSGGGASASTMMERPKQERFVLDLRKVPANRRLEVATQLLGPERGQRLVDEFNAWLAKKNRRAAQTN